MADLIEKEAPSVKQTQPPTVADIEPWFIAHRAEIDTNRDGKIEVKELFETGSNKKFNSHDASIVVGILYGFELIDGQAKPDGGISEEDVKAMGKKLKEDPTAGGLQKLELAMLNAGSRTENINKKLWGDFTNPIDAIKPDAVGQGAVGDCWFLGSVAAVADTMPEVIARMIKEEPNGQFTVTFPGEPKYPVTVEAPTAVEMALFARSDKHGSWVAVLEKAAAKLFNSNLLFPHKYDIAALDGGDCGVALSLLTGEKYSMLDPSDPNLRQKLEVAEQWGLPVCAGSKPIKTDKDVDERGVFYMHVYTVEYDPRDKQVSVRNPWGWKLGSNSEPVAPDGSPKDGIPDGVFKLSVPDFWKSFPAIWIVVP